MPMVTPSRIAAALQYPLFSGFSLAPFLDRRAFCLLRTLSFKCLIFCASSAGSESTPLPDLDYTRDHSHRYYHS
ncbi:hypothetical protein LZ31DRAFT_325566 [Colletotrichum somersetense]|nr:hypothetical protein LZ31DRAFT_325566 [Colletotrichum somersetense]